jgi:hypothetical protein
MRSVVSNTQVLVYDLNYFGDNPFSVNGRPDFVWSGSEFTIRPIQSELSSILDPSVDVILKQEDSRHTRVLRGVRAPYLENEILVARETVRLNSVDPSRTFVFFSTNNHTRTTPTLELQHRHSSNPLRQ